MAVFGLTFFFSQRPPELLPPLNCLAGMSQPLKQFYDLVSTAFMDAAEMILKHSEKEKQLLKKNLSSHLIFSFTGLLTHLASPPTLPDQPMLGVSENLDSVAFGHN